MAVVLLLGPFPSFSMLHIIIQNVPAIGLAIEIIIVILIVYISIIVV